MSLPIKHNNNIVHCPLRIIMLQHIIWNVTQRSNMVNIALLRDYYTAFIQVPIQSWIDWWLDVQLLCKSFCQCNLNRELPLRQLNCHPDSLPSNPVMQNATNSRPEKLGFVSVYVLPFSSKRLSHFYKFPKFQPRLTSFHLLYASPISRST